MGREALEAMYETILQQPGSFSRESLLGWIMAAHDEITRLEDEVDGLYEDAAGASI